MEHLKECELFIENRDIMKKAFMLENSLMYLGAAAVYTLKGRKADVETLKNSHRLLKEKAGLFSGMRGMMAAVQVSICADPETAIENMVAVNKLMKKDFSFFSDLSIVAMSIALSVSPERFEETVIRAKRIYEQKNKGRLFADEQREAGLCALMAMSDRTDEALLEDMAACHALLKEPCSGTAARSLAATLALYDDTPEQKAGKAVELLERLKDAGGKYDKGGDLSYLGVVAMSAGDIGQAAAEIMEIDGWLAQQKGFGPISISRERRMMFAALLSLSQAGDKSAIEATVMDSIASIITQQILICAAVTSAVTMTSINSNSRS